MSERISTPSLESLFKADKEGSTVEHREIQLGIRQPDGDKGFMITFHGRTPEECMAYNAAIRSVLDRAGLLPFHQVGVTPTGGNEPGLHGWEVMRPTSEARLRGLFVAITAKAQELL